MKIEKIKELELRKRIMKLIGGELWEKALQIWYKRVDYDNRNLIWRITHSPWGNSMYQVKEIQMDLLDKEVEEAKG